MDNNPTPNKKLDKGNTRERGMITTGEVGVTSGVGMGVGVGEGVSSTTGVSLATANVLGLPTVPHSTTCTE